MSASGLENHVSKQKKGKLLMTLMGWRDDDRKVTIDDMIALVEEVL